LEDPIFFLADGTDAIDCVNLDQEVLSVRDKPDVLLGTEADWTGTCMSVGESLGFLKQVSKLACKCEGQEMIAQGTKD
jgi:hypothetical protein